MHYILGVIFGVIGGVLGGMGMGGGTLLIPLLTMFLNVGQHSAQAINLIAFIPCSVVALIVHIKNKRIDFKDVLYVIISGIFTCIVGSIIARKISGNTLKQFFGGFLFLLSVLQFVLTIKTAKK